MSILFSALIRLLSFMEFVILAQCIVSWIPSLRESKVNEMLSIFTDPIENPIREILYRYITIPVDFSPVVAIILIQVMQNLIFIIAT